jgi:hypothetical protein
MTATETAAYQRPEQLETKDQQAAHHSEVNTVNRRL